MPPAMGYACDMTGRGVGIGVARGPDQRSIRNAVAAGHGGDSGTPFLDSYPRTQFLRLAVKQIPRTAIKQSESQAHSPREV